MALGRRQAFGAAIVEDGVIEGAGPNRGVEIGDGLLQHGRIEFEFNGQLRDRAGLDRREQRRHEAVAGDWVEDDVGDLVRLRRHEPAPDWLALRPDILPLLVKKHSLVVYYDARRPPRLS